MLWFFLLFLFESLSLFLVWWVELSLHYNWLLFLLRSWFNDIVIADYSSMNISFVHVDFVKRELLLNVSFLLMLLSIPYFSLNTWFLNSGLVLFPPIAFLQSFMKHSLSYFNFALLSCMSLFLVRHLLQHFFLFIRTTQSTKTRISLPVWTPFGWHSWWSAWTRIIFILFHGVLASYVDGKGDWLLILDWLGFELGLWIVSTYYSENTISFFSMDEIVAFTAEELLLAFSASSTMSSISPL